MAHVYDSLHDRPGVSWLPGRVPGWDVARLPLMDIQLIIALAVGLCACLYVLRIVAANFKKSDVDAKCEGCSAKQSSRQSDK